MTESASMRVAAAQAGGGFAVEDRPLPEPGPGEVRVRIEACGVCGSDLHLYHSGFLAPGSTPGHEFAGVVEALGAGVEGLREGQRVTVEPLATCGECAQCRSGRENVCRRFEIFGVHLPGGFADCVVISARRCFPIDGALSPRVAAMTEPVAVALHGLERGGFEAGQRVLVLGAGMIGLATTLVARAMGATAVWTSARHEHQAHLAREMGAHRVLGEEEASGKSLARLARGGDDFDLVVETVGGGANTLADACSAIKPGGTVSVLGLFMTSPAIDPYSLLLREGCLCWSNCYARPQGKRPDFARAATLVEEERERLALLATHELPLAEIGRAFELASDRKAGAVKVSVIP
ncbi:MAG: alcohol dehydrogenase catalytic domain-containing protein [Deltaproteobacteria bacterium]|nr:alcohol dehydrogenase catalytic domain-containing protein [Deltaproteobacteria bacterium]